MITVTLPDKKAIERANALWARYIAALGQVASAWNHLQQELGQLFTTLSGTDRHIALTIWNSSSDDRTQRRMLSAVLHVSDDETGWVVAYPSAQSDIEWILSESEKVANRRNDAIHSPLHCRGARRQD